MAVPWIMIVKVEPQLLQLKTQSVMCGFKSFEHGPDLVSIWTSILTLYQVLYLDLAISYRPRTPDRKGLLQNS